MTQTFSAACTAELLFSGNQTTRKCGNRQENRHLDIFSIDSGYGQVLYLFAEDRKLSRPDIVIIIWGFFLHRSVSEPLPHSQGRDKAVSMCLPESR